MIAVDAAELAAALVEVGAVIDARCKVPILAHVALLQRDDALVVRGTNFDQEVAVSVSLTDGPAGSGFATTLPPGPLRTLIAGTTGDVTLAPEGAKVAIRAASSGVDARLSCLPYDDYPEEMGLDAEAEAEVAGDALRRALAALAPAISRETTRYYLCGIYHDPEAQRLVATDGHRLVAYPFTADLPPAILPDPLVRRLMALKDVKTWDVRGDERRWMFRARGERALTVASRTIDGTYPDWRRVVPAEGRPGEVAVTFDRAELKTALERMMAFQDGKVSLVTVAVEGGAVTLHAKGGDVGSGSVALPQAKPEGGDVKVGFNTRYLLDALACDATPETAPLFRVRLDPGDGPAAWVGAGETALMPYRL